MGVRYSQAPTLTEIEQIAAAAFDSIPERLRQLARDVVIRVTEFPDTETEAEMGLQSPFDILGLYQGIPVGQKIAGHTPTRGITMAPIMFAGMPQSMPTRPGMRLSSCRKLSGPILSWLPATEPMPLPENDHSMMQSEMPISSG